MRGRQALTIPLLRSRDFSIYLTGVSLSNIGSRVTLVAMAFQMYQLTNSPLSIGVLGLSRGLPAMAFSLFGGVLADSRDRRRLLMSMQLVSGAVSATLAMLTLVGQMAPWMLVVASVLYALSGAVMAPSQQAVVPNLIAEEDMRRAVALYNMQRQLALVLGPSLAGFALSIADPWLAYGIDTASWLAICGGVAFIKHPLQGRLRPPASWRAVVDGIHFVWSRQVILAFMLLDFGAQFFGSVQALLPIYARDILHAGPLGLGFLYAALPVGSLVAATAMSTVLKVDRAGRWVLIGVGLFGLSIIGFALSDRVWVSAVMLGLAGLGSTIGSVLRGTTNQLLTPDHMRGRVAAINQIFTTGGPQFGQFESGVVGQLFGAPVSALTGGIGAALIVGLIALLPSVRRFRFSQQEIGR